MVDALLLFCKTSKSRWSWSEFSKLFPYSFFFHFFYFSASSIQGRWSCDQWIKRYLFVSRGKLCEVEEVWSPDRMVYLLVNCFSVYRLFHIRRSFNKFCKWLSFRQIIINSIWSRPYSSIAFSILSSEEFSNACTSWTFKCSCYATKEHYH